MDKNILEKLRNIKAVVFDSVGVIFSEKVFFDSEKGEVLRMRSHHDGQGINLLRAAGIKVAFITSESNGFLEKFADKLNNSVSVKSGKFDPITVFSGTLGENRELSIGKWLEDMGFSFNDCAYMGDDIGDYLIMKKVFFPVAPKSANKIVKDLSIINIENDGGSGAIREFVDFVLLAKDVDIINFPLK